ncbi:MAG: hypothetical protein SVM80_09680 [Halobacteriota archaeon]|nr:hypothetical protein [Halobacteriota archaeon]
MAVKIDDVNVVERLLEEGKEACLYCIYYSAENGCDRIFKQTRGRTKIEITKPLEQTCGSFVPVFRCEDCYSYKSEKLEEALWGKDEKATCVKHNVSDEDIKLCIYWEPNEEKMKELKALYEAAGFEFKLDFGY